MKRALLALLLLASCAHSDVIAHRDAPAPDAHGWTAIDVSVRSAALSPGDLTRREVGDLVFRGGVELKSDSAHFGGLSGITVSDTGEFVAVSDTGFWVAGALVLNRSGDLTGVKHVHIAPLRDGEGRVLTPKANADSEEVAHLPDGRYAVSFERTHLVRIYDLDGKGPAAPAEKELMLGGVAELEANQSLEAMSVYGDRLLIGAERGGPGRQSPFWIVDPSQSEAPDPAGRAPTQEGFGLVSLARLPDGDFIAMERLFSPASGLKIHLRRVSARGLEEKPPVWSGPPIADLRAPLAIDNFEGVAALASATAAARLYMVSDDNFSRAQRTLIYAFDLKRPAPSAPASK